MVDRFDTAVFMPGRGLYVFADDLVWRYGDDGPIPDRGFPRPIAAEFPGAFARRIDAALMHPDGALHLFRGDQSIRYDVAGRRPELGYPRPYAADWPGVSARRIDAALTWGPDIIYLFSGDSYTSFSPRRGRARPGFPKPIPGNWPGMRGTPLRAAVMLGGNHRILLSDTHGQAYDQAGRPVAGGLLPLAVPAELRPTGLRIDATTIDRELELAAAENLVPRSPAPAHVGGQFTYDTYDVARAALRPCAHRVGAVPQ
jgi:hypothetical protein